MEGEIKRRTVLVPLDSVSVIHRELMVEVVVSLSHGDESCDEVILGSVLVVVRSLSDPVSERVDAEGRLSIEKRERILVGV